MEIERDRGETLVELLVALVVISVAFAALVTGILSAIQSSTAHRGLAVEDAVLRSIAASLQSNVLQPAPGNTPGFSRCGGPYKAISAPVPASGPPGQEVTIFETNYGGGGTPAVTVAGVSASSVSGTGFSGVYRAVFAIPATAPAGADSIVVDGIPAPSTFLVNSAQPQVSAAKDISATSSIGYFDGSNFTYSATQCLSGSPLLQNLQSVHLTASALGTTDEMDVALDNPASLPDVKVTSSPSNPTVGGTVVFTAQVLPPQPNSTQPTGTVTWNQAGCASFSAASTGTCAVPVTAAGTMSATAIYSGDSLYAPQAGTSTVTASKGTLTFTVTPSANPTVNNPVTFTATATGSNNVTPSTTISWTITYPDGTQKTATNSLSGTGNTATANYTFTPTLQGTYTAQANYGTDPNYNAPTPNPATGTANVKYTASISSSSGTVSGPTNKPIITFSLTLTGPAGPPTGTANVTWSVTGSDGSTPACTPSPGSLVSGTVTCSASDGATNKRSVSYTATATYGGDSNYAAGEQFTIGPFAG